MTGPGISDTRPTLSIVVMIRHPNDTPDAVLAALDRQDGIADCEGFLVDGRPEAKQRGPDPAADRAWLQRISSPETNMPRLKAMGAHASSRTAVAFLEPRAVPGPRWLGRVRDALRTHPGAAFGGGVRFDARASAANQAAFAFEYGIFAEDSIAAGHVRDLSANNMVLPRDPLLRLCGDILNTEGLNKPFCQERLRAGGVPIVLVPDMAVALRPQHTLWSLYSSRFSYARCFGGTRVSLSSAGLRWKYRLGAPAVPFMLLRRHARTLRRADVGAKGVSSYIALAGLCAAWAGGEAAGSWAGPGKACRKLY